MEYIVIFLRKMDNILYKIGEKRFKHIEKSVQYAHKEYIINPSSPCYARKNKFIYFFDFDTGRQLTFNELSTALKPEELDLILGQKIIRDICRGLNREEKIPYFYLVIGIILGILLGMVIMQFYMQDFIRNKIENPTFPTNPIEYIRTVINLISLTFKGGRLL